MDETTTMVKKWAPWAVAGLLALIVLGGTASAYNGLVAKEEAVASQSRQVEVAYQRAFRLVPQLTDLAEQYMAQETEVMESVAALRSGLAAAENGTLQAQDAYLQEVVDFVALVGNRAEAYPELQSAALYQDTMTEVTNSENKIAMEKVRYNDRVQAFNAGQRRCCFPLLAASLFGFDPAEYVGYDEQNPAGAA